MSARGFAWKGTKMLVKRAVFAGLLSAAAVLEGVFAIHKEMFTTNAVCSAQHCINPVFPGLEDTFLNGNKKWSCQLLEDVADAGLAFCGGVVNYNPSLPVPATTKSVQELVKQQEQEAMTTYFLHLSAMGLEAWDHKQPSASIDPCIQSVWRMACYTHFPKAE
eukprot:g14611.t1